MVSEAEADLTPFLSKPYMVDYRTYYQLHKERILRQMKERRDGAKKREELRLYQETFLRQFVKGQVPPPEVPLRSQTSLK